MACLFFKFYLLFERQIYYNKNISLVISPSYSYLTMIIYFYMNFFQMWRWTIESLPSQHKL